MKQTFLESIRESLATILEKNENAYLLGEDIVDPYGGAFKATKGLSTRFPDRVLPTPISEAAIVGVATGMALRGNITIAEIMFGDFLALAADQIINHASKLHMMYGTQLDMSLVIRTAVGGGRGYGPTHSQNLERLFLGTDGLQILAPSLYHSPGETLKEAVASKRPTLFLEHKLLYPSPTKLGEVPPLWAMLTEGRWPTAFVKNFHGGSGDVTIISYGGTSLLVDEVSQRMIDEEVRITACFPLSLNQLPEEQVLEECAATGRVIVVEEGPTYGGWSAEISAWLHRALGKNIRAPVVRVGAANSLIPNARSLERDILPSINNIEDAILAVLSA